MHGVYFVFFFPVFLGPHLWHMTVPRLGVKLEPQLPAYTTITATRSLSHVSDLHHSSRQCRILNPLIEARDRTCVLMDANQICFHCATMGGTGLCSCPMLESPRVSPSREEDVLAGDDGWYGGGWGGSRGVSAVRWERWEEASGWRCFAHGGWDGWVPLPRRGKQEEGFALGRGLTFQTLPISLALGSSGLGRHKKPIGTSRSCGHMLLYISKQTFNSSLLLPS